MRIALFGANGQVGKRIATEALDRGHDLLAVVRNPALARLDDRAMVTAGDATHPPMVSHALEGVDVVVSAIGPRKAPPVAVVRAAKGVLAGLLANQGGRILIVGCAQSDPEPAAPAKSAPAPEPGSGADAAATAAAPKRTPVRSHGPAPAGSAAEVPVAPAPAAGSTMADAHREVLALLEASPSEVDWTWVCPTVACTAGERSGAYAAGPEAGGSTATLTLEDLAVAILDEVEKSQFGRGEMAVAGVAGGEGEQTGD